MNIGIDFGGVIVKPANSLTDFIPERGLAIEQESALKSIKTLVGFATEVWIISKASIATQRQTRVWLNIVDFYQMTDFSAANIRFCEKRFEKKKICDLLSITHFVDDNLEVLENLRGSVPNLYFFGVNEAPQGITPVKNWAELINHLQHKTQNPAQKQL